jgi:hypothetical protein
MSKRCRVPSPLYGVKYAIVLILDFAAFGHDSIQGHANLNSDLCAVINDATSLIDWITTCYIA